MEELIDRCQRIRQTGRLTAREQKEIEKMKKLRD